MDNKFAKDAFEKAEAQRLNAEAEAWAGVAKAALASTVGVAIFHAGMDMVKVIEFVQIRPCKRPSRIRVRPDDGRLFARLQGRPGINAGEIGTH